MPRSAAPRPPGHRPTTRRATRWLAGPLALVLAGGCGDSAQEADEIVDDAEEMVEGAEDVVSSIGEGPVDELAVEVAETLRSHDLTTFASALEQSDLSALVGDEPFTILAPTDEAFRELDADATADLLATPEQLEAFVSNHVIPERLDSSQLATTDTVTTAGGAIRSVDDTGDVPSIGGVDIVTPDIEAGAGVVHVVNGVFLP